ncbi:phage holin family protein [Oxalobacter vibrioformis]|uniref:Phage holin family protein n=1 Tax=Oxalobacter vibrioformis TaxID=933080 RepID=A0A9E9LW99_9BURK|nr:phage holin family protein [Oxalobacter vibrioformis]WAW10009.1 phage holin family protein [Oxalobacter vibrioformis]
MSDEKDPQLYSLATYGFYMAIALMGGIVAATGKYSQIAFKDIKWGRVLADIVAAIFVGLVTFWGCELGEVPKLGSAVCVAIMSHIGSRALIIIRRIAAYRAGLPMETVELPERKTEDD